VIRAGELNRRAQFLRGVPNDDGLTSAPKSFAPIGSPVWAKRRDISDGEKYAAAQVSAQVTTRFTVRLSDFTAGITAADQILSDGVTYDISGIKQLDPFDGFEMTANAVKT